MTRQTAAALAAAAAQVERGLRSLPAVSVDPVRAVRREASKAVRGWAGRDVVALAGRLFSGSAPEARFLAYELVQHHPAAAASLRARDLERFARGLDGWASVDTFSCYLAGPAWRAGQVGDRFIARLASSKDRWRRRAALVATVPLVRGQDAPRDATPRALSVCDRLLADRDDMVVKAMSWALRELSKRDPVAVRRYLAARGERVAARVRREVVNKLSTGLKNPRRGAARPR